MGADRAILIVASEDVNVDVEPLAVAKLLKAVVEAEAAGPGDRRQAGDRQRHECHRAMMLAALLGWPLATFASAVEARRRPGRRTREVDGGLRRSVALPAIVTVDLRLNEPRYASLPNIMKAKKKPLEEKTPADYGVDVESAAEGDEDGRAVDAQGRGAGRLGRRTGGEAQVRGGGALMAVLVYAKHDNAALNNATAKTVTAAKSWAATSTCWSPARAAPRSQPKARRSTASPR